MANIANSERRYAVAVGMLLRAARLQKQLSLGAVEERSHGEFKSAVLGAYEHGSRVISVPRLHRLAAFYDVPLDELLPDQRAGALSDTGNEQRPKSLRFNLTALRSSDFEDAKATRNFIERVRVERHDFDGRIFTIRIEDIRVLGGAFGLNELEMIERLDDLNLLIRPRR